MLEVACSSQGRDAAIKNNCIGVNKNNAHGPFFLSVWLEGASEKSASGVASQFYVRGGNKGIWCHSATIK
jgi:hypothetical protein